MVVDAKTILKQAKRKRWLAEKAQYKLVVKVDQPKYNYVPVVARSVYKCRDGYTDCKHWRNNRDGMDIFSFCTNPVVANLNGFRYLHTFDLGIVCAKNCPFKENGEPLMVLWVNRFGLKYYARVIPKDYKFVKFGINTVTEEPLGHHIVRVFINGKWTKTYYHYAVVYGVPWMPLEV